jgi:hypothetical protein
MKTQTTLSHKSIVMVMVTLFACCCFGTYAQPKSTNNNMAESYKTRLDNYMAATEQRIRYVAPGVAEEDEDMALVTLAEVEEAIRNLEQLASKTEAKAKYTAPRIEESFQYEDELVYLPEIQSSPVNIEFHDSREVWLLEAGYTKHVKSATANGNIFRRRASTRETAEKQ